MTARIAFADTPEPPYHVVVFTSQRGRKDEDRYLRVAERMVELEDASGGAGVTGEAS